MAEKFLTRDEVVAQLIADNNRRDPTELAYLEKMYREQRLALLHLSYGMWIRNHFGLWNPEHPVTELWAQEGKLPDSPHHPDQYSFSIIEEVCAQMFGPLNPGS